MKTAILSFFSKFFGNSQKSGKPRKLILAKMYRIHTDNNPLKLNIRKLYARNKINFVIIPNIYFTNILVSD